MKDEHLEDNLKEKDDRHIHFKFFAVWKGIITQRHCRTDTEELLFYQKYLHKINYAFTMF